MPGPPLDIRELEVERRPIPDRLDLAVEVGEMHAPLGANGSGKTTLACVLMGCDGHLPRGGRVPFDGAELLPLRMH